MRRQPERAGYPAGRRCLSAWWAPPPSKRVGRAIPVRRVRFPSTSACGPSTVGWRLAGPPSGSGRPGCAGFPSTSGNAGTLRPDIAVVYFCAMKKFFLFVLVAVLVAWVAKKVREV